MVWWYVWYKVNQDESEQDKVYGTTYRGRTDSTGNVMHIIISNLVHWIPCRRSWSEKMWICYDIWPRHCRLSFGLLPAALVTNDCAFAVGWRQELVQSFVSCRLDCNALLFGVSGGLIQRLQSVQNAAARLVTGAYRRDHITPVLRLPVKHRIDFKLAVLVYKSLHGFAPPYLSDNCQLVKDVGRRHLRSSDVYTCVVSRTQSQSATGVSL